MYRYAVRIAVFLFWVLHLALISGPVAADAVLSWGGSNYIAFGLDINRLNSEVDWKNSDIFKTPACFLHSNHDAIERDLSEMASHGQKKVALMLWHMRRDDSQDCSGFLLRSNGGSLTPKVMENLIAFINIAKTLGFNEVQVRFAPMGKNWPKEWASWDEALFQENWAVIRSTVSALKVVQGPRIVIDLGVELGGLTSPGCVQCSEYVRRMWQLYSQEFGVADSYGFSIAYAPERLGRLIDSLRGGGTLPKSFAIDIYSEPNKVGNVMATLAREARSRGIEQPILLVQETFYADREVYQALVAGARANDVILRAIMQWPQVRGSSKKHVSVPSTPDYYYQPVR